MEELKNEILKYLAEHRKGHKSYQDIIEAMSEKGEEKVTAAIQELEREYMIFKNEFAQYETREQAGLIEGRISINRAGMGFVDREDMESIKIDQREQHYAMHGDTVLVKCQPWQVYGTVFRVLKRARDHVIGTWTNNGRGFKLELDDEKLKDKIIKVLVPDDFRPVEGLKVLCNIEEYRIPMVLRVTQVIGYKDDPGVDILSVLLDHDIEPEFPEEVMAQVAKIPQEVLQSECEGRTNLTNEITVTIDGDTSKDFDDAVSVTRDGDGYILKVSIADVAHYVQEGTPLDQEAFKRGCSTYVTDRVVPMLPHELSNGICSLNPHVVRLTQTCEMKIDRNGKVTEYSVYPSYIRSTERMTYNNVNRILDGDEAITREYEHLGDLFFVLRDCADAIRRHRTEKGAIAFDSVESLIKCDKNGHPYDIVPRERGHAEEMIEDCMIAANVSVANFMKWQDIPSVYRIHAEPQAKRIKDFVRSSELMGHKLVVGKSDIRPNQIQRYLESVKDTPEYPVLSMLMLRCMQKAKYDNTCIGHFGLAEEEYLHFTSPIRRYPDLIVHRMLRKYSYEGCLDLAERKADEEKTAEYALQSSIREKMSTDAEYACLDMKKAEYMQDHLGMIAEGIITGVQNYGFYVELPNTVEGLVRVMSMRDDYYSYDQDRMQLTGQRTHKQYRVGQTVKVMCTGADKAQGNVDFQVVGKDGKVSIPRNRYGSSNPHESKREDHRKHRRPDDHRRSKDKRRSSDHRSTDRRSHGRKKH